MAPVTPLAGRTALVTGASSGIGAAVSGVLARAGAKVWMAARRRERLEELARGCPGAQTLVLDVRDPDASKAALAGLGVDLLVANAGLAIGVEKLPDGRPEDWSVAIDTNVKGVLNVVHAVVPGMVAAKHGDLVLIGSVAGRQVYPGGTVYCATKHAVRAIYEGLRLDLAGSRIRISTVDPGMVGETEFSTIRFRGDGERARKVYEGVDYLKPADVAEAVAWIVTRPARVNVGELVMWASAQASTTVVTRRAGASA